MKFFMYQSGDHKIRELFQLIIVCLPGLLSAQDFNKTGLNQNDSSLNGSMVARHSFFAGTGAGSNMVYLGSTISHDQPYYYGNLTYGFSNKIYASASTVHLSGIDPFLAFYIGSLTYNQTINSWFDLAAGIYRYQVPTHLSDTLFNSFTYADLTLGFDWKILYTKLSAGGLLSDENQFYCQLRNSRYFQTNSFLKGKATISFDPYANLLFGSLIELKTNNETTVIASTPGRKWKKYTNQTTTTNNSYIRKFGLLEADFGLPVAFNTDKMTIEAEVNYTLPVFNNPLIPVQKGFVFMLSAFFRIL